MNKKILFSLVFALALVAGAFFMVIPVNADDEVEAGPGENCYTASTFTYPVHQCKCIEYICYAKNTERWNGGHLPSSGTVTRNGESCSNGSGWSSDIGEWGNVQWCKGTEPEVYE